MMPDTSRTPLVPAIARSAVVSAVIAIIWTVATGAVAGADPFFLLLGSVVAGLWALIGGALAGWAIGLASRSATFERSDRFGRIRASVAAAAVGLTAMYVVVFLFQNTLPPVVQIGVPAIILAAVEYQFARSRFSQPASRPRSANPVSWFAALGAAAAILAVIWSGWWALPSEWTGNTLWDGFASLAADGRLKVVVSTVALVGIAAIPAALGLTSPSSPTPWRARLGWLLFGASFVLIHTWWYHARISEALRDVFSPVLMDATLWLDRLLSLSGWAVLIVLIVWRAASFLRARGSAMPADPEPVSSAAVH